MRFLIRDVLWLILASALVCGWYVDHMKLERRYANTAPFLNKFELHRILSHINENAGVDNLHFFEMRYGRYYGTDVQLRFTDNEVQPVIKHFHLDNEGWSQSSPPQWVQRTSDGNPINYQK